MSTAGYASGRRQQLGRLLELLADRATQGLTDDEHRELDELLTLFPDLDADALDWTAAALTESLHPTHEPLSESLQQQLASQIYASLGWQTPVNSVNPESTSGFQALLARYNTAQTAWYCALICFVLALAGWWPALAALPTYSILKTTHVGTVILSGSFFALRGVWMLTENDLLQQYWVRIAPHIIDTVLLASAIALAVLIQQYPFVHSWLSAKVLALLAYIIFGSIALRRGKTKPIRVFALGCALLSFGYMVLVALHHHPWPWMV